MLASRSIATTIDVVDILLDPAVEPLLEVGIVLGRLESRSRSRGIVAAFRDGAKVECVGSHVEAKGPRVAVDIPVALAHLNLLDGIVLAGGFRFGEPVLGRGVAVAKDDRGQAGDGVVEVGDAELGSVLGGNVVADNAVADAGGAKGVNVHSIAIVPEIATTKHGNSSAERVAGRNNFETRVGLQGGCEGSGDALGHLAPRAVEAVVDLSAGSEGAVDKVELKVANPILDVAATADRQNNFAADFINSQISGNASVITTVESQVSEIFPYQPPCATVDSYAKVERMVTPLASRSSQLPPQEIAAPASTPSELQYEALQCWAYQAKLSTSPSVTASVPYWSVLAHNLIASVGLTEGNILKALGVFLGSPDGPGGGQGRKRKEAQGQHVG